MASKFSLFPEPRGPCILKAVAAASLMGETLAHGAGLGIAARTEEDGPETWETSYLHLKFRCNGGPVINLRLATGCDAAVAG